MRSRLSLLVLALAALVANGALSACTQQVRHGWTPIGQVEVGRSTGPVTLGGRWAFAPNTSDGTVTQIERTSGKVVATVHVTNPQVLRDQGCAPDSVHAYHSSSWGWRACDTPYALTWDGTNLWAIDNGLKQLVRVDPVLHQVTGMVALPGTGWSATADATTVWVTGWADDSLYVVDVQAQRVTKVVHGLDQGPSTLALGSGALWVVCARGVGLLDRIDPATSELVGRYDIEWWSNAVAADQEAVYVRGTNGGDIVRVQSTTGAIEWTQPGPGFIGRNGVDQIALSPDGLWVGGPTTVRMDPRTGHVLETLRVGSTSVAAARGEVWLVQLDGSVTGFKRR